MNRSFVIDEKEIALRLRKYIRLERPPVKIGCANWGTSPQTPLDPLKRAESEVLSKPRNPVSEMRGR
jgi:hypothetical protein